MTPKQRLFLKLSVLSRFVLGGVFLYACLHKIADPPDFAKIIYNYKLLPATLINLAAIYLPWLELLAGAVLIGEGILILATWRRPQGPLVLRGGAIIAGAFALLFVAALGYNLARGCPTICGCFETYESQKHLTDEVKFAKMRKELFLDVGLFLLALQAFLARGTPGAGAEELGQE